MSILKDTNILLSLFLNYNSLYTFAKIFFIYIKNISAPLGNFLKNEYSSLLNLHQYTPSML